MRVLTVIGTRPEAIKMAPLIMRLNQTPGIEAILCSTGQHREMLKSGLDIFGIVPDLDLNAMSAATSLNALMGVILQRFDQVLEDVRPDVVLVHGDTTTSAATAMAAFHRRIRIGHVEAGLRTRDLTQPWPEEFNRRVADVAADDLFAPTERAKQNLLEETLGTKRIHVTGNTIVDALQLIVARVRNDIALRVQLETHFGFLDPSKRLVLVTTHRRENFGKPLEEILTALRAIAAVPGIQIVLPVHLNPNVRKPVLDALSEVSNVHLTEPVDYAGFIWLLDRSSLVITDSGGIQEEAPSLGKPVLVMRDVTERPEGIEAGFLKLVGTSSEHIIANARHFLTGKGAKDLQGRPNPYGDGKAAERIVAILQDQPAEAI